MPFKLIRPGRVTRRHCSARVSELYPQAKDHQLDVAVQIIRRAGDQP
jgi:hypothetical protein